MSLVTAYNALKNVGQGVGDAIESALVSAQDFVAEKLSGPSNTNGDDVGAPTLFCQSPGVCPIYIPSSTFNHTSVFIDLTADDEPNDACSTECKIVLGAIGLSASALSDGEIPFSVGVRLF